MTSDSASRVTRSRRSLRAALVLFAACLAAVGLLRAQETAPAAKSTGPEAESPPAAAETAPAPAEAGPGGPGPEAGEDSAAGKATPADSSSRPARDGTSPGRFEPTEKVRADFDVSFPVDI